MRHIVRLKTAAEIKTCRHRQLIRTTGIVTHRQRPDTKSGVIFITIEDETGYTDLIVWRNVQEQCKKSMLRAQLLTVFGPWRAMARLSTLSPAT